MQDYDAGTRAWVSEVAAVWADVPAHPLLYMLSLPQGQSWVSVLIGFREERRASRLQAEEKSSTRHMDGL